MPSRYGFDTSRRYRGGAAGDVRHGTGAGERFAWLEGPVRAVLADYREAEGLPGEVVRCGEGWGWHLSYHQPPARGVWGVEHTWDFVGVYLDRAGRRPRLVVCKERPPAGAAMEALPTLGDANLDRIAAVLGARTGLPAVVGRHVDPAEPPAARRNLWGRLFG